MEIKIGEGIGDIKFGITQETLESQLGRSSKLDTDEDNNPLIQYNQLMCTFWFGSKGKLHWVECSHPQSTLFERKLIACNAIEAIEWLSAKLNESPEFNDYGSMESYHFEGPQLELQVAYGVIIDLCFGNLWEDDDTPIYPEN